MNNRRGFVYQKSEQPAAERAFAFESRRIAGGCEPAVVDGCFDLFVTVKNSRCDQVQQSLRSPETDAEDGAIFIQLVRH